MIYAGFTSLAVAFWSFVCFMIYLLLSCDGGMVVRWFVGLFVIMMYHPVIRFINMDWDEWKSFLLACVGILASILAFLSMLFYITR